ncbi:MAG: methylmalonyl-CoA mutase family protein, partial [Nitrososphaera sp.]
KKQLARLKEFKAGRDMAKVNAALATLQGNAEKEENLMPHIINCVKNYTTLGEISDTLRGVFGRYEPKVSF